ncbi:MAG: leucine-rich repeat protein [Ruminococcus sp.]|nr:leucine-rich repeat protein [Ruminococcus sp.]
MKKRLLSIVTATAMTLTALPLTVNAAEISDYINSTNDELVELFNGFEVSNDYETDKSIILTDNETQLMRLYDKNIMSLIYYPSDINDVQEINKMIRKAFPKSYSSTFDNEDEIGFYFNSYGYIEIDTISGTQEQFKQLSDEITSKFVVKKIIIKTIDYTGDLFEGKHGETLFSGVTSKIVNLYSENVLYSTENENEETLKAETYINTQALAVNIYNATTTTTAEPITTETTDSTAILIDNSTIKAYGECGANTKWTLDSNGKLTISGTGNIAKTDELIELSSEIKEIVIENENTQIEYYAFQNFPSLESVKLPNSIWIDTYAFEGCTSLTDVEIPKNVSNLSTSAFYNTPWLENLKKENDLVIINDMVIDGTNCKGDIEIPNGVTMICGDAFYMSEITSVELPNTIKSIGAGAFNSCQNLKEFTIPDTLEYVPNVMFAGCVSLEKVVLPNSIIKIGYMSFAGCSKLESIKLPDNLMILDPYAFSECTSLKVVNIPKNTTNIYQFAFYNCSSLEEIVIENPMCIIFDSNGTISNIQLLDDEYKYNGVIRGLKGSTAEIYAKTYGIEFAEIKTESIKGDANCDGNVNMADAVLIMQSLANPDKYGVDGSDETHITEQGIANGDMDGNGLTNADALEIQKKILKLS